MVATPSAIYDTPNANDLVESRLQDIERLAEAGDWQKIESLLKRLPQIVARIPVSERRDVLLAARTRIERIRELAVQQSDDISARLATIKTGRQAAESYRVTSAMSEEGQL